MKDSEQHWTWDSDANLQFAVAFDFIAQIEKHLEEKGLIQEDLAGLLNVSPGRVSQILNNPQKLTLSSMARIVRALGVKFTILAYDDNDSGKNRGHVNSEVFMTCWEAFGCPKDGWDLEESGVFFHKPEMSRIDEVVLHCFTMPQTSNAISSAPSSYDQRQKSADAGPEQDLPLAA